MAMSQSAKISGTLSSYMKVALGINLFLNSNGGLSGECSKHVSDTGLSASESTVRSQVRHLSENIHLENIMDPPPKGYNYIVGLTSDNADFHLYAKNVSLIAAGRICLGLEKEKDTKAINNHFLEGLPKPSNLFLQQVLPTKDEDRYANNFMLNQTLGIMLTCIMYSSTDFAKITGSDKVSTNPPVIFQLAKRPNSV